MSSQPDQELARAEERAEKAEEHPIDPGSNPSHPLGSADPVMSMVDKEQQA